MADQSRPRAGAGQLPAWFGVPFLLGGLLMIGLGVVLLLDELRFGSEGVATSGVVVEKIYSSGGEDGASYEVRYEFVDSATGARRGGSSDVSEGTYDSTSLGDAVEVTYLPAEPTKSRLGSTDLQLFIPLAVMGGGAIFLVVGAGLLVIVPRMRRQLAPPVSPRAEAAAAGGEHRPTG